MQEEEDSLRDAISQYRQRERREELWYDTDTIELPDWSLQDFQTRLNLMMNKKEYLKRFHKNYANFHKGKIEQLQVKSIKPLDGYYDIYGHGNIGIISLDLSEKDDDYLVLNAKNLIYLLKQSKDYKKGTNIRILSCLAGTDNEKGISLAQEVANALNVNVIAPDGTTLVELNGNIRVKIPKEMSLNTKIEGSIKKFIPKRMKDEKNGKTII